jgi:hypothetical protein
MKAAWSFEDREFAHKVFRVLLDEEPTTIAAEEPIEMPIISQPAEWNTDDGLGAWVGLKNAVPLVLVFWLFAGIGLYLAFKQ